MTDVAGIRLARVDDYPAVCRLAVQLHREHVAELPLIFDGDAHPMPKSRFLRLLEDPSAAIFVADPGDGVTAFAVVVARFDVDRRSTGRSSSTDAGNRSVHASRGLSLQAARRWVTARRTALIRAARARVREISSGPAIIRRERTTATLESIAVDSAHRGQGLGRALTEAGRRWARDNGAQYLELTVWDFNRHASDLYRSMGFDTLSRNLWLRLS